MIEEQINTFERRLLIACHSIPCGYLIHNTKNTYTFVYFENYKGSPISLAMPVRIEPYIFDRFPPYFDGLLPEGVQLEALIRQNKIDPHDYMSQLESVGNDLVGAITIISPLKRSINGEKNK